MKCPQLVIMLVKEVRTIFAVQLAWMYMLVDIFVDVLFGGLGYGTLQPHCARMRMASVPMQAELQAVAKFTFMQLFARTRMGRMW